jgi:alpha-mannosidase
MNRMRFLAFFAFAILAIHSSWAQVVPAPSDPYQPVLDRLQAITTIPLDTWQAHGTDLAHGEDPALSTSGWQTVHAKQDWSPASRWLRTKVTIPERLNGYNLQDTRVKLDVFVNSNQSINVSVFVNGNMVSRTDQDGQIPITLVEKAQRGQTLDVAVRVLAWGGVGCCGGQLTAQLQRAQLLIEPAGNRPDPAIFRLEVLSAEPLIAAYSDGKSERQQQLDAAVRAVNPGALDKDDQAGFDASLRTAQGKLEELRPYMKQFSVQAVGNSHIDMAWLWPESETVEVVRNTFGTALELMREYPDFKFTASAAQAYTWIEEKYPLMFQEIQQRVKEGRWEVIGGMWVEPDLNMPDGESLVRQILYGKRYFQQKFGVEVNIGWNPDSFGYNGQLPQIYKRSGIDYFVTQKLLWASEFTKFPYRLFWWEAPDGSRLMTYFPSDYANAIDPVKMARDAAIYGSTLWKYNGGNNAAPPESLKMMYLYGVGDHGGGPTRNDLDIGLRWQKPDVVYPRIEFATAGKYLNDLTKGESELNLPTWKGELYFQYHRGVQTTQAEEKKGNRKNEVLILEAEKLASIDTLFGGTYPQSGFDDSWKKILFNQFHDILPGSGIHINYVDAARKYTETALFSNQTIDAALKDVAAHVNSPGLSVLIFNSLSFTRTDEVDVEAQFPNAVENVRVIGPDDKPMPSYVFSTDPRTNRVKVSILAQNIPATGYKLVRLVPQAKAAPKTSLVATDTSLENEFVKLTVDPKTGCMTSLIDKKTNTEALALPVQSEGAPAASPDGKPCGNLLQTFVDKPQRWDAWNIDADFVKQHWDLMQAEEVKLIENTPLRAMLRVRQKFQNSSFIQDITMYPGVPRVDVNMQAEWHEKHILLKVAFPLSARSDHATFEIPYGTIERPTTRNTPAEQAQFEVPAFRWADLSDASHGFSLLNDSKYGYDAKDNVLRLSLLRSPEWPDPHADEGHHEFTYSLYPHAGTWAQAQTLQQGYQLNYPLMAVTTTQHLGPLPGSKSFFGVQESNVVITAVKKDADDNSLIVRFYEWDGKKGDIHLSLPQAATSATETNLMEKTDHSLALASNGTVVVVPTNPYEVKTVKVAFGKP